MSVLMVPIRVDALHLPQDLNGVMTPLADFSALPWIRADGSGASEDVNPDIAFTSQNALVPPFADTAGTLERGIHLHWALPRAVTVGRHPVVDGVPDQHRTEFPAVPNRWLVVRTGGGTEAAAWMVESDYLWPPDTEWRPGRATYLVAARHDRESGNDPALLDPHRQPYRFLGRSWNVDSPPDPLDGEDRLERLLAVGYGEPTFAEFYPGCRDVFGFHDVGVELLGTAPDGLAYDVFGWYATAADDVLHRLRTDFDGSTIASDELRRLGWTWDTDTGEPDRILCHGRVEFSAAAVDPEHPDPARPIAVALGNTGTEALSAHLARRMVGDLAGGEGTRRRIEQQLEALHLADALRAHRLDVGPKFVEFRHTNSFHPVSGGNSWTLVPTADATSSSTVLDPESMSALPYPIAVALHELGEAQQSVDRASAETESLRRQVFAEWHKYITCCYHPDDERSRYPDVDAVRAHVDGLIDQLGTLVADAEARTVPLAIAIHRLTALMEAVPDVVLARAPGPRFWQPNDPVVLLSGPGVQVSDRHVRDAELPCRVVEAFDLSASDAAQQIIDNFDSLRAELAPGVAVRQTSGDPWHPVFLEWAASISPLDGNVSSASRRYDPAFVEQHYELREDSCEFLSHRSDQPATTASTSRFHGRVFLSDHAGELLGRRIDAYLTVQVLRYLRQLDDASLDDVDRELLADGSATLDHFLADDLKRAALLHWGAGAGGDESAVATVLAARDALALEHGAIQTQALGGFHEALLMHEQVLQLEPADPLGFAEYREFTEQRVAAAVAGFADTAPEPRWDFHPIRSGEMHLERLRLVDTFGRVAELETAFTTTQQLSSPHLARALLPPRICQPARVAVRWLPAEDTMVGEANRHPSTSPVCGWVVPNNLDSSLMVYDAAGALLGYVDAGGRWRSSPGRRGPTVAADIAQRDLSRFVLWLQQRGQQLLGGVDGFVEHFIDAVDSALENIDPEGFAQHESRALLMGRPMALVRVSVGIELLGLPAYDQSYDALNQALSGGGLDDDGFTDVRFPVRIGEHMQLNDGVVGFWMNEADGSMGSTFYAPQSEWIEPSVAAKSLAIDHPGGAPLNFPLAISDEPRVVTVLLDPRGSLHCTTGVLPTEQVRLVREHYAAALASLSVTFLASPLLTPPGRTEIPLPAEPGTTWSWLQRDGNRWTERTTDPILERREFVRAYADGGEVWSGLVAVGWLVPLDALATVATPTPPDRRDHLALPPAIDARRDEIKRLIDVLSHALAPARSDARFGRAVEIREGWLQLVTDPDRSTQ